jgi:hypothetical protein
MRLRRAGIHLDLEAGSQSAGALGRRNQDGRGI